MAGGVALAAVASMTACFGGRRDGDEIRPTGASVSEGASVSADRNPCLGKAADVHEALIQSVVVDPERVNRGSQLAGYKGVVDTRICATSAEVLGDVANVPVEGDPSELVVYAAARIDPGPTDAGNPNMPPGVQNASAWLLNNLPEGRSPAGASRGNFEYGGSHFVFSQGVKPVSREEKDNGARNCKTYGVGALVAEDPNVSGRSTEGWMVSTGVDEKGQPDPAVAAVVVDNNGEWRLTEGGTRPAGCATAGPAGLDGPTLARSSLVG